MTDEEILTIAVSGFADKLGHVETWADFKTWITVVSKNKVKNIVKNKLEAHKADLQASIATMQADIPDIDTAIGEIDAL